MCGIFALLNNSVTFSPQTIRNSFEIGVKRGPEQSTLKYVDDDVCLGFHRLAINGLDLASGQPMSMRGITLICNGEIYNYEAIYQLLNETPTTASDCEAIIHLYLRFGIEYTLNVLDGVFAFVLLDLRDDTQPLIHVARDPYGVRPLYMLCQREQEVGAAGTGAAGTGAAGTGAAGTGTKNINEPVLGIASELKVLHGLCHDTAHRFHFAHVNPGSYLTFTKNADYTTWYMTNYTKYHTFNYMNSFTLNSTLLSTTNINRINSTGEDDLYSNIYSHLYSLLSAAVKKRVVGTSERKIACLLSGGLDSSLIAALVNKHYDGELETYCIGMPGSVDVMYAELMAQHLGTKHTSVIVSEQDFFDAIPEVIHTIESYDTTTVRASVGNYLIGKYIKAHSDAKVIFNGDGSDELMGGYLYFKAAPSDIEFDRECKRLLADIFAFDVLRSDKCISSHGLEPRTPFLDRGFVDYYLSLPVNIRNTNKNKIEKALIRNAIALCDPLLLPHNVLWRNKEAFSDGVSSSKKSWFQIINEKVTEMVKEKKIGFPNHSTYFNINLPQTLEQQYYRYIFDVYYPNTAYIVPYFWMPKYVDATDASARTLSFYQKS